MAPEITATLCGCFRGRLVGEKIETSWIYLYPVILLPSSFFLLPSFQMGTRGNYIFRYKGRYYVFYNHFDSYFRGLGAAIVMELQCWKAEDFENAKAFLANFPLTSPSDEGSADFNGLMETLRNPKDHLLEAISDSKPIKNIFHEYFYTIDFDHNLFIVEWLNKEVYESQRYSLTSIPDDWIELTGTSE